MKGYFTMAKQSLPHAPLIGDGTLARIIPTIEDAIAVIEEDTAQRVRKLRAAARQIAVLPKGTAIPTALLRTIDEHALEAYADCLADETPAAIATLANLKLYAKGVFVLDDAGNFVDREDYSIEQINRRIAAIDWSREPANADERKLRKNIIASVESNSATPYLALHALKDLCTAAAPAKDLAKAIAAARTRNDAECAQATEQQHALRLRSIVQNVLSNMQAASTVGPHA